MQTLCEGILTPSYSRTFTAACSIPSGLYTYNAGATEISVAWRGVFDNGIAYRVRWRPVGTTTWTESTTTGTTNTTISGLTTGITYEWQVQTICNGQPTGYSANGPGFTTACLIPESSGVTRTKASARLSWSSVGSSSRYDVQYRLTGTMAWTLVSGITTTSYSITGLTSSTAYQWQVRTRCSDGSLTDFSSVFSFTTSAP